MMDYYDIDGLLALDLGPAPNQLLRISEVAAEYGEDCAARAARAAVRRAEDGEPYLTAEEIERLLADMEEIFRR